MKKTLSLILAAAMLLAGTVAVFADDEVPIATAVPELISTQRPFTAATMGGAALEDIVKTEEAYTYINWSAVSTTVDLYTITVPDGTQFIKLSFDSEKLCYNYAFTGEGTPSVTDSDYLSGAVADENTQDGKVTFTVPVDSQLVNYDGTTVPADGVIDYVQIQTPYDSEWNTTVLYAITFKMAESSGETAGTAVFADVPSDAVYADAVSWAYENGITAGVGNGNFGTGRTITREQMVTFLWNMAGQPQASEDIENFSDVEADQWYAVPIAWAKETKVSAGKGNNIFGVGETLTRQQVVWFLANYTGRTPEEIGAFVPLGNLREDVVMAIYNVLK